MVEYVKEALKEDNHKGQDYNSRFKDNGFLFNGRMNPIVRALETDQRFFIMCCKIGSSERCWASIVFTLHKAQLHEQLS